MKEIPRLMRLVVIGVLVAACFAALDGLTCTPAAVSTQMKWHPGHYAMPDRSCLKMATDPEVEAAFDRWVASLPPEIVGIQGGAYWRNLETGKGVYDFTVLEKQLSICARHGKRFFCTISERHFNRVEKPVPDYLYTDPEFGGGVEPFAERKMGVGGSIARIWDPVVLDRFNRLVDALGKRFDREPFFEGIEFVETALAGSPSMRGLTLDAYLSALRSRLLRAKKAFPHSIVLQEANWLVSGLSHGRGSQPMEEFIRFCYENGMGIGGPDLIPDWQRDAKRPRISSYEYFPQYAGRMPLACDVQGPQYLGRVGPLILGEFTPEGIYAMGVDTLKLNYFFWSARDKPDQRFTFTGDVLPLLKRVGGRVHTNLPENLRR